MIHTLSIRRGESGFILITVAMILVPLLIVVAGGVLTMVSREKTSNENIAVERSLMAAEAGVDQAIYLAGIGSLPMATPTTLDVSNSTSVTITAIDMLADGVDNDGDSIVDESDETGIQVTSVGDFRGTRRALIAYLRTISNFPAIQATSLDCSRMFCP